MPDRAIEVLRRTIRDKNRLLDLLRNPTEEQSEGWFMFVPGCFNEALDITLDQRRSGGHETLVWTQGPHFSFKTGDVLYDSRNGYRPWSDALKKMRLCVQVVEAMSAGNAGEEGERDPGSVALCAFSTNSSRTGLVELGQSTMSQDDFVEFLISGPKGDLAKRIGGSQPKS